MLGETRSCQWHLEYPPCEAMLPATPGATLGSLTLPWLKPLELLAVSGSWVLPSPTPSCGSWDALGGCRISAGKQLPHLKPLILYFPLED